MTKGIGLLPRIANEASRPLPAPQGATTKVVVQLGRGSRLLRGECCWGEGLTIPALRVRELTGITVEFPFGCSRRASGLQRNHRPVRRLRDSPVRNEYLGQRQVAA